MLVVVDVDDLCIYTTAKRAGRCGDVVAGGGGGKGAFFKKFDV